MARKQPTGFIGKKAARIWSGVMGFGVLMCYCIGIYIGGDNRPIKNPSNNNIDPPKNSAPGDYPDGYYEPPTIVKPGQENITIPTETIIPVIPEDTVIKPGANTSTDIPSDDILTKFTSLAKTSIYNLTGNEPNLAVTEIMIFNKGTHIKVDGELYLNGNHNNFSAIVTNPNTSLEIFNMDPNNVSDNEYLQAFDQFLSSPETSLKIQLNQHFKISNPDKAITHLIQYRLNELKAYEPSSKEIPYLSNLLSDVSTSKISVSLAQRVQSGSNFIYTFTTLIETDTISYKIPYTFESKQLNNAELTEEINKILTTGNNFNFSAVYSTSAMNAATHIINSSTNVEYNNNVTK